MGLLRKFSGAIAKLIGEQVEAFFSGEKQITLHRIEEQFRDTVVKCREQPGADKLKDNRTVVCGT